MMRAKDEKLYAVLYFPDDKKTDIVPVEQLPVEDRYEGVITKVKWRGTEYPALIEKISADSKELDATEDKIGKRIELEKMMDGSGTTASRRRPSRAPATHSKDYASEQEVAMALGEKKPVPKQHLVAKKNAAASSKKAKMNRERGEKELEEILLPKTQKEQRRGLMPEHIVTAEDKLTSSLVGGGDSQEMSDSSDAPSYVFTHQRDMIEDTPQKTRKQDEKRKKTDENRKMADQSQVKFTPKKSKWKDFTLPVSPVKFAAAARPPSRSPSQPPSQEFLDTPQKSRKQDEDEKRKKTDENRKKTDENRKMEDESTAKFTPKKLKWKDSTLPVSPVKFAAAARPPSRSPSQPPSQEFLSASFVSRFEDDNAPATQPTLQKLQAYYNPSVKIFLTELISAMEVDTAAAVSHNLDEGESDANIIVDVAPVSLSERQVELVKGHGVFISSSGKSVVLLSNVKRDSKEGGKGTSKEGSKKMLIALLMELFKERQKQIRGTRSIRPYVLKAIIAFMDKHSAENEKLTVPEIKRVINVSCNEKRRRGRSKETRAESNKEGVPSVCNPESTPNKKGNKYSRLKKKSSATVTSVITQSPVKTVNDMRSPIKFRSPSGKVLEVPRLQSRTPVKHKPVTENSPIKTSQPMEPPKSQQTQQLPTWSQSHSFHQQQQAPYYQTQPPQQNYSVPWYTHSYPSYNPSQTYPSQQSQYETYPTNQNVQGPQSQWGPSQNVQDTDTSNTSVYLPVRNLLMDL